MSVLLRQTKAYLVYLWYTQKMNTEVIIYDCDGVIVDSRRSNEAFFNHILASFGLPPLEPEQLELIYSFSDRAAID